MSCKMNSNLELNKQWHRYKYTSKNINKFEKFTIVLENEDNNEENMLPPINDIIWGVGFKERINKSWADQVNT